MQITAPRYTQPLLRWQTTKKRTFINSLYVLAVFFMLDVTSSYLADIAEERISVLLKGLRNVLNAKFC